MKVSNATLVAVGGFPLLVIGISLLVAMQPARATPQFAKETGKSCAQCHTDPKGGAALTAFGSAFKANGNKLP